MKITEQQKQFFKSQGYVVLENVLSPGIIDHLSQLCSLTDTEFKQFSSDVTLNRDSFDFNFKYKIAKRIAAQNNIQIDSKEDWKFRSMIMGRDYDNHPKVTKFLNHLDSDVNLHSNLKSLLDSTTLQLLNKHIWKKYAQSCDPTEVHRDYTAFNITGSKAAIVWISPSNVSSNDSALQVIPGSHRELTSNTMHTVDTDYFNRDKYNLVTLEINASDMIILDLRTQHCATPNISNEDRCAAAIRYYGDDVEFN